MGLFDIFKFGDSKKPSIDLTDFKFLSDDHVRIENGRPTTANNKGAWRGIRVKTSDNFIYSVAIYNINENHPVWGDNIQMAPKQMKIVQQTNEKIVFRGFGHDNMGSSFSDYGLTITIKSGEIDKCKLHMHDRNVDIEYLKANEKHQDVLNSNTDDFEVFINFIQKWNLEISRDLKYAIAKKTDELTNIGVDFYEEGDIENAINFYNQALSVMPCNDDALKNLKICYSETNNILKFNEVKKKLDYLNSLGM